MNKLLQTIDVLITEMLPYMAVTTLVLAVTKLLGYATYSWFVAFSPMMVAILVVGAVNLFSCFLDQE